MGYQHDLLKGGWALTFAHYRERGRRPPSGYLVGNQASSPADRRGAAARGALRSEPGGAVWWMPTPPAPWKAGSGSWATSTSGHEDSCPGQRQPGRVGHHERHELTPTWRTVMTTPKEGRPPLSESGGRPRVWAHVREIPGARVMTSPIEVGVLLVHRDGPYGGVLMSHPTPTLSPRR
ncbi:hypothetical protein HNR07_005886 [Nocardiopsis metallicus]|uniref:Uncharacterized protein n=1 Tax=Nocardiopsis metallicus TaxID=179819 RepID=A0A840WCM1_9ACTN|nr:hypothetical protein [Nocardiopsis metallicus]